LIADEKRQSDIDLASAKAGVLTMLAILVVVVCFLAIAWTAWAFLVGLRG
jgi:hypothetical protein